MKYGIANRVNHYHAVIADIKYDWWGGTGPFTLYPQGNLCNSDTGVFTMINHPNETHAGGDWEYRFPKSTTMIVGGNAYNESPGCCVGGLNMNTSASLMDCDFFGWARSGVNSAEHCLIFKKPDTDALLYPHNNVISANINAKKALRKTLMYTFPSSTNDAHAVITADKIEIAYVSNTHAYCYLTGVSMAISHMGNIVAMVGEIISRVIPAEQDYIDDTPENAICIGSVYFDATSGKVERYIAGTGVTASVHDSVHQAFDDTIMSSNSGVAAVSCMVTTDGAAKWLAYKNCVYRLYQGNTPLLGTPNERIMIKGHEFVCPAYGSYYVRIS